MLAIAASDRVVHPWVAEGQHRVRFGVGVLGTRRAGADLPALTKPLRM
jgi:hypothetical protein